jgi:hypothetical protein
MYFQKDRCARMSWMRRPATRWPTLVFLSALALLAACSRANNNPRQAVAEYIAARYGKAAMPSATPLKLDVILDVAARKDWAIAVVADAKPPRTSIAYVFLARVKEAQGRRWRATRTVIYRLERDLLYLTTVDFDRITAGLQPEPELRKRLNEEWETVLRRYRLRLALGEISKFEMLVKAYGLWP